MSGQFQFFPPGAISGIFLPAASGLLRAIRDILVPAGCLFCNRPARDPGALCAACWRKVEFVRRPFCEILGHPFAIERGEGAVSPAAIANPPPFDRLRCAVLYGETTGALVSALKFTDRTDLAPWMASWMAIAGKELLACRPIVIPVPLHRRRLLARRYNQSAELARGLCRREKLEYGPECLVRIRMTSAQVGLSVVERARNVQGAFQVPVDARPRIEGRHVLLVDDVYTSGATAGACTRALRRAGAKGVDVLVFASVLQAHI